MTRCRAIYAGASKAARPAHHLGLLYVLDEPIVDNDLAPAKLASSRRHSRFVNAVMKPRGEIFIGEPDW